MERVSSCPLVFVDGAHNPDGAYKLKKSLEQYFAGDKYHLVIGVLADKDYPAMLEILLPKAKDVITITPQGKRALPAQTLKETVKRMMPFMNVKAASDLKEAWNMAVKKEGEITVICGSLSFLGELDCCIKELKLERKMSSNS